MGTAFCTSYLKQRKKAKTYKANFSETGYLSGCGSWSLRRTQMWRVQGLHQLAAPVRGPQSRERKTRESLAGFSVEKIKTESLERSKSITADRIEKIERKTPEIGQHFSKYLEEYWLEHACEEDIRKHRENSAKELVATEPDAHRRLK